MNTNRNSIRDRLAGLEADALLVTKLVNVRYLTGFSGSNGQLLIGESDLLLTDSRYEEQSAREAAGCPREIYDAPRMSETLGRVVQDRGIKRLAVEAHHMTLSFAKAMRHASGVELVETTGVVEKLRIVKSPEEAASLRKAAAIGDAGFNTVLGRFRDGMTEREAAAELEDAMRRAGSEGLSFDTIVAFGESAAEPHHAPSERRLAKGDLIKLDFGATWGGYHSDMTRTIAFGRADDERRRIHGIVYDAQRMGVEAVKAGVACGTVDAASRDRVEAAGYGFGHGTGHGIGLEVHEAPSVRKESVDILAAGMAVTVEPGIYLPGFGGVRIEDTVLVTDDGCEVLTNSPRELIEV
ncbi:MAG: M24 family metallopeptidase [Actinomycetota bacterium]|nr:Xaa-Pro peptidase family protein [Actinomycetota bacterium]